MGIEKYLADPNWAILLMLLSALCICVEFCRPASVVPGVVGGVGFLVGLSSLLHAGNYPQRPPIHWPFVLAVALPSFAIFAALLAIAVRARRNKSSLTG